ncbi:MAG: flagellar basal body rod protein [Lysobacterales bacterium CG17_big_fil_post_rev_8_21_14_2_50_64_11]|nr:MAG: flagellar basal body rod protein [Xanthomonadales bacterium CG17_big_fil_post_rev_8_21_14_2_50_64_11]PIX61736.1 MAG: flagellar basal body rod protein [Xanthomonadales bacterium CG_4_10_14_3_um_filter_64_11]
MPTVIENMAKSGIEAGLTRLAVAANNIANAATPGFARQGVIQSAQVGGGTQARVVSAGNDAGALLEDQVNQLTASYAIQASTLSLKVAHNTLGTLLDQRA